MEGIIKNITVDIEGNIRIEKKHEAFLAIRDLLRAIDKTAEEELYEIELFDSIYIVLDTAGDEFYIEATRRDNDKAFVFGPFSGANFLYISPAVEKLLLPIVKLVYCLEDDSRVFIEVNPELNPEK